MGQISDSVAVEKQTCRLQNRLMAREGYDATFSAVVMGQYNWIKIEILDKKCFGLCNLLCQPNFK